MHSDIDYGHIWRGFLQTGPAKIAIHVGIVSYSIYISSLQEISSNFVNSILEPCQVKFLKEIYIIPPSMYAPTHIDKLKSCMNLSNKMLQISRDEKPMEKIVYSMDVRPFKSYEEEEGKQDFPIDIADSSTSEKQSMITSMQGINNNEDNRILCGCLSLLDIGFLHTTVLSLIKSLAGYRPRLNLVNTFSYLLNHFDDYIHLPRRHDFMHVVIPFSEGVPFPSKTEVILDCCQVAVRIRNNIYCVKLLQLEVENFSFSFSWSSDNIHMASSALIRLSNHNDRLDVWEPIIESLDFTAISATDQSAYEDLNLINNNNNNNIINPQKLRFEVLCSPVDINISQSMLSGLVRKLALADVITTNSSNLPPYQIHNELGVAVLCEIVIGNRVIVSNHLQHADVTAIDIKAFDISHLNRYSLINSKSVLTNEDQYSLSVTYQVGNRKYKSHNTISINVEGLFGFEMREVPLTSEKKPGSNAGSGKFGARPEDIPAALVEITIEEGGSTHLTLRGMLTFENITNQPCYMLFRRLDYSLEKYLQPSEQWYLPIHLAHPQTNVYARIREDCAWSDAISNIGNLVYSGRWGMPTKVKAEFCVCPFVKTADVTAAVFSSNSAYWDSLDSKWCCLFLPDVSDPRPSAKGVKLPVKFPLGEMQTSSNSNNSNINTISPNVSGVNSAYSVGADTRHDSSDSMSLLYEMGLSTFERRNGEIIPMTIQICSPLQLTSLLPQPLLYRLSDRDGLVANEGVLTPGQALDLHKVPHNFKKRLYISVRLVNYGWSNWVKIFSQSNPFPISERISDINLLSLDLSFEGKEIQLPSLTLTISMHERCIRIFSPFRLVNRSGLRLAFRNGTTVSVIGSNKTESALSDDIKGIYLPLDSLPSAEVVLNAKKNDVCDIISNASDHLQPSQWSAPLSYTGDHRNISIGATLSQSIFDKDINTPNSIASSPAFTANSPVASSDMESMDFKTPLTKHQVPYYTPQTAATTPNAKPVEPKVLFNSESNALSAQQALAPAVNLVVHLPTDHFESVSVTSEQSWCLRDVYRVIMRHMMRKESFMEAHWSADMKLNTANSTACLDDDMEINRQISEYVFFPLNNSTLTPKWLEHSPSIEEALFGTSALRSSTSFTPAGSRGHPGRSSNGASSAWFGSSSQSQTLSSPVKGNTSDTPNIPFDADFPHSHRFGMIAGCTQTPLWMDTPVSSLAGCTTLRMCHVSEWDIYLQISSIRLESPRKDSSMLSSMFTWQKNIYRASFLMQNGEAPFSFPSSITMSPSIMVRVTDESEWSDNIHINMSDYNSYQVLHAHAAGFEKRYKRGETAKRLYDFGIGIERGKGALHRIKALCVVPKYLFVSNMNRPLSIRQADCPEKSQIIILRPNAVIAYHFPYSDKPKYIQVQMDKELSSEQKESVVGVGISEIRPWSGEFDIASIGSFHVKLRDPLFMIKVHVENVGASLVVSFSAESVKWPPYRIENMTSFDMRFKQHSSKAGNTGKNWPHYDNLSSKSICPYAWDFPQTGNKLLRLEFLQPHQWDGVEISPDDFTKPAKLALRRKLPDLNHADIEGLLLRNESNSDIWNPCYCVLDKDILYLFQDDSKSELQGIICLTQLSDYDRKLQLSRVSLCSIRSWDVMDSFESTFGIFNNSNNNLGIDLAKFDMNMNINMVRLLLIKLIIYLDMMSDIQANNNQKSCLDQSVSDDQESNHSDLSTLTSSTHTSMPSTQMLNKLLEEGFMDHVLRQVKNVAVSVSQVMAALISIGEAEDSATALSICKQLIMQGVFVKPSAYVSSTSSSVSAVNTINSYHQKQNVSYFGESPGEILSDDESIPGPILQPSEVDRLSNINTIINDRNKLLNLLAITTDVFIIFQSPTLQPSALEEETNAILSNQNYETKKDAFSITVNQMIYSFLCPSTKLLYRWLYASRLAIEMSALRNYVGNYNGESMNTGVNVNSFSTTVIIKVYSYGPTQVMVIASFMKH